MNTVAEEKNVLRMGGLAGILSGILFFLTILLSAMTHFPLAGDTEALIMAFPDLRLTLTLVEGMYLAGLILWVTLMLTLRRTLRQTSLMPALGSTLALLGIAMLAVGSLLYVGLTVVSGIYHTPGTTSEEQATLVIVWVAAQIVFMVTDDVGHIFLSIAIIFLGMDMCRSSVFSLRFGRLIVAFGIIAVAAMTLQVADPRSLIGTLGIFLGAIINTVIIPILWGWKVYVISKAQTSLEGIRATDYGF